MHCLQGRPFRVQCRTADQLGWRPPDCDERPLLSEALAALTRGRTHGADGARFDDLPGARTASRERAQHREIAEVSLRRFWTELQANRTSVAAVKDKHIARLQMLRAYFAGVPARRPPLSSLDDATDPAFIESSAWDLALATQSLAYIDSDLTLAISHVYAAQRQLEDATRAVTQAMYATTDGAAFLSHGLATYWGDCTLLEPRLLTMTTSCRGLIGRWTNDGTGDAVRLQVHTASPA